MCKGARDEHNDPVIRTLGAIRFPSPDKTHTHRNTTQSAWPPTESSGLDRWSSTTSDNINMLSVFVSLSLSLSLAVCCLFSSSLLPVFVPPPVPQLCGTRILKAELPWRCSQPSREVLARRICCSPSHADRHTQTHTHTSARRMLIWSNRCIFTLPAARGGDCSSLI